jgi:hypothetical protein
MRSDALGSLPLQGLDRACRQPHVMLTRAYRRDRHLIVTYIDDDGFSRVKLRRDRPLDAAAAQVKYTASHGVFPGVVAPSLPHLNPDDSKVTKVRTSASTLGMDAKTAAKRSRWETASRSWQQMRECPIKPSAPPRSSTGGCVP